MLSPAPAPKATSPDRRWFRLWARQTELQQPEQASLTYASFSTSALELEEEDWEGWGEGKGEEGEGGDDVDVEWDEWEEWQEEEGEEDDPYRFDRAAAEAAFFADVLLPLFPPAIKDGGEMEGAAVAVAGDGVCAIGGGDGSCDATAAAGSGFVGGSKDPLVAFLEGSLLGRCFKWLGGACFLEGFSVYCFNEWM